MGSDPTNIVSSILRSVEPNRSPSSSQRASEVAQSQLTGEAANVLGIKRTNAADALDKNKIKQEHEYRRRHFERQNDVSSDEDENEDDGESGIDVVV